MAQKWINSYERCLAKSKDFLARHPNMGKRYRDYLSENYRTSVCSALLMMHYNTYSRVLPADIMQWVEEHSAVDTSLPVNLISGMASMLRYQRECYIQSDPRIHVLQGEVSALPWLASKGMLHLSDEDNVAISQVEKMRRETYALYSQIKDRRALRDSINSIQEKYTEYIDAVVKILESDDYQKAVSTLCAGGQQGIANDIIDSLVTDPIVNSIHHAQILNEYIDHERCALPEEMEPYIALIKEPYFRNVIIKKNDYYKQVMKEKAEAVNSVIHPSSDVEGLTDGKAIIDKIIEPYRGKIVYLDIWGTWCAPCKRKLSKAHELKAELKDYDIVYLYFALSSEDAAWKGAIVEYGLTKPNYVHYNLPEQQQDAVKKYLQLDGVPFYVLFDKQGNMQPLDRGHMGDIEGFKKRIEELSKK
jgi:thiol-disulfide isomerase/thioredoxin